MSDDLNKGMMILNKLDDNAGQRVISLLGDVSQDFSEMLIKSFGEIFSRSGLDLKTRELITIASLTSLGSVPDRLKTHIRGALNVGATQQEILETIIQMSFYAGYPAAVNAMLVAKEIFITDIESKNEK